MSRARTAFTSAAWNHAGRVLEFVLLYATSVAIARALGVVENGTFVGLISLSQLLLVLCSFGLEVSLNTHLPKLDPSKATRQTRYILRRFIRLRVLLFLVAAIVVSIAVLVLSDVLHPGYSEFLFLMIGYSALSSVTPLLATALTAQLRTRLRTFIGVAVKMVELTAVLWLAPTGLSVATLFVLFICTSALHVVLLTFFSHTNLLGSASAVVIGPMVAFGGAYSINTVVDYFLGRQGDVLLLLNLLPDSSQASLYDVAFSLMRIAALMMTVGLGGVTLALFARMAATKQHLLGRFYGFMVRVGSLLSVPAFAFLMLNAETVVSVLYTDEYAEAASLLRWMCTFRLVSRLFAGGENAEYLLAVGRVVSLVKIGLLGAAINVALNLILIPEFRAMGAVAASGAANLIVNALGAYLVHRASGVRVQGVFWLGIVAAATFSAGVASMVIVDAPIVELIVRGLLFLVGWIILLGVIKPLRKEDMDWLTEIDLRLTTPLRFLTRG